MSQSPKFCPVPSEQQPINEYQELKGSWFFSWVTLSKWGFIRKLVWIWFWSLLISTPIAAASFPPQKKTLVFLIASGLGASVFVALTLIRLYLGWAYVGDRLKKRKIVYEESSWYDGQVWEKPVEFYYRDQLIFKHQVEPMIQRLQKTGVTLMILMVASFVSLLLISNFAWI